MRLAARRPGTRSASEPARRPRWRAARATAGASAPAPPRSARPRPHREAKSGRSPRRSSSKPKKSASRPRRSATPTCSRSRLQRFKTFTTSTLRSSASGCRCAAKVTATSILRTSSSARRVASRPSPSALGRTKEQTNSPFSLSSSSTRSTSTMALPTPSAAKTSRLPPGVPGFWTSALLPAAWLTFFSTRTRTLRESVSPWTHLPAAMSTSTPSTAMIAFGHTLAMSFSWLATTLTSRRPAISRTTLRALTWSSSGSPSTRNGTART
mmetsp:Transcript_19568/g.62751  ORF Transcript_19568/g.62751 Transcript_19568/m.62751 type:complete len:268 (-) Transcript_19568:1046-1849(-)